LPAAAAVMSCCLGLGEAVHQRLDPGEPERLGAADLDPPGTGGMGPARPAERLLPSGKIRRGDGAGRRVRDDKIDRLVGKVHREEGGGEQEQHQEGQDDYSAKPGASQHESLPWVVYNFRT